MKWLPWALVVVVCAVAIRLAFVHPPKDERLSIAQAQLAQLQLDSAQHAATIRELEDSLQRRMKQAHAGLDEARRLAAKDSTLRSVTDSLASVAITAHDWELAYQSRTTEADTLRRALVVSQGATNDALASLAFSRLQHIADSTRLAKYDQAAPIVLAASKPSWWRNRVVVTAGVGTTITGGVIRVGPQASVGVRLWSL